MPPRATAAACPRPPPRLALLRPPALLTCTGRAPALPQLRLPPRRRQLCCAPRGDLPSDPALHEHKHERRRQGAVGPACDTRHPGAAGPNGMAGEERRTRSVENPAAAAGRGPAAQKGQSRVRHFGGVLRSARLTLSASELSQEKVWWVRHMHDDRSRHVRPRARAVRAHYW